MVEKNRKYIDNFYQLLYISVETSNKYFPTVGSTFTYFLIEKKLYYKNTIIEYLFNGKIDKTELKIVKGFKIPKILTKTDISIISKTTSKTDNYILNDFMFNNKTQRIRKEHIIKNIVTTEETETHNIKIIDTISKTKPFPGKYYYYNHKDSAFDQDKLVLSKKGYLMPYIDRTKSYAYSDNFKYIIDDDLDKIKMLFESKIVKYLLYQYSKNGFDSIDIIKTLRKRNLSNIKNEIDLCNIYDLTRDECIHINNLLKLGNKDIIKSKSKNNCIDKYLNNIILSITKSNHNNINDNINKIILKTKKKLNFQKNYITV